MKKILIVWSIVAIILITGLTFIGINLKNKNRDYYALENKIQEAAKKYYSQYPNELPASESSITAEQLYNSDFLNNLNNKSEKCNGYVTIKRKYVGHDYTPFIKCSNYQTKKYEIKKEGDSI